MSMRRTSDGISVETTASLQTSIRKLKERLAAKLGRGLLAAGNFVLERSNENAPKDTTAMVQTGRVTQVGSGLDQKVVVGYGGTDHPPFVDVWSKKEQKLVTRNPAEYAMRQHQDLNLRHDEGQTAKFLERAVHENLEEIKKIVREA